jgi:hypothetical protein
VLSGQIGKPLKHRLPPSSICVQKAGQARVPFPGPQGRERARVS